ncbi:CREB-regulated transcription coactivator 1-like isoform X2 [Phlebotomus argentipes]|uniref:CREB-regulated transcription coactivator 1-like isoform X2 n=1 Tax=Phlebotomus argentipes TaxID=94469 RepID=UPI002892B241|nr:CREB-regulated transcription coactivator 1-like isoform X2 [Phlebotomus argentipes]
MANPRKFSEKIALLQQKQAEETAAFEKIMREVSDATSKPDEATLAQFGLGMNHATMMDGTNFKGGGNASGSPGGGGTGASSNNNSTCASSNQATHHVSRVRNVGVGPMRRPADRKIDTSPYSNNIAYLSPPSDSSWRRTSSDSAIHQSLTQAQDHPYHHQYASHSPLSLSPTAQKKLTNIHHIDSKIFNSQQNSFGLGSSDGRPRSSCGRLPGINIHPSAHDNSIQIPIGNNTGSLPDLTSVHFPSPLHTPIDQEHDHSSSPYSSSPVTASPTTLSPTSMPVRHPGARFHYSPTNSPGDTTTFSPTHSQQNASQQFLSVPGSNSYLHMNKGLTLENSFQPSQGGPPVSQQQSQQSPQQTFINCHPPHQYPQQQSPQPQVQQSQTPTPQQNQTPQGSLVSSTLHGSHGNLSNIGSIQQSNLSGYRSPQCRPSPGSSPNLIGSLNSGDSNPSAPCSPAPSTMSNNGQGYEPYNHTSDIYYVNQQNIQQHFEAFSLDWATLVQSLVETGCTWTAQVQVDNSVAEFVPHSPNQQTFNQFDDSTFTHFNATNLGSLNQQQQSSSLSSLSSSLPNNASIATSMNSNSNMSPGMSPSSPQQQHPQAGQSQQQATSLQTPNTPTSIPEIVFTDFSSASSEFTKDLFGDPLMPLELELGPIDVAGFQMLTNPSSTIIGDPTEEDNFRTSDLH